MRLHDEELSWARLNTKTTPFEGLSSAQLDAVRLKAKALRGWFVAHFDTHCAINAAVVVFLLAADGLILLWLPGRLLGEGISHSWSAIVTSGLVIGSLRGWLMYSLVQYSLHEGAGSIGCANSQSTI